MSWAEIKKAINSNLAVPLNEQFQMPKPLDYYFPFIGGSFPFNGGAANITISADTTWDDVIGFKQVGVLTINAGKVLTIARSPFYIFADEIVFGDAGSVINGNGPNGADAGTFSAVYARGATAVSGGGRAQGGCGGIMLAVLANKISGANGAIRANGGNGWSNNTNASAITQFGGQGALSNLFNNAEMQRYYGGILYVLSDGGGTLPYGGAGGGSGGSTGGGSGFGGGGGQGSPRDGKAYMGNGIGSMSINLWVMLAQLNCLGGGGGTAYVSTTGANSAASGGGGGAVLVIAKQISNTPTVQANGGVKSGSATYSGDGGAGFALVKEVSF